MEQIRQDFLSRFMKEQELIEEEENKDKSNISVSKVELTIKGMEFLLKHAKRIGEIEHNRLQLVSSYRNENDPHKKKIILDHILSVTFYLSIYQNAVIAKSDEHIKKLFFIDK